MVMKTFIQSNTYQDSVALMRLSGAVSKMDGITNSSVMMGTPLNKTALEEAGLLTEEAGNAKTSDLILVVEADSEETADSAIKAIKLELEGSVKTSSKDSTKTYRTISKAKEDHDSSNIAFISTPGSFAATEALLALKNGMHPFIFSDNVSIEDEVMLKKFAHQRDLLVMGPDCGTGFLGGVPLGFANSVRRGGIGIIGASGTGTQEVMCTADRLGGGISHAIGIGSHDLSLAVGGISMLDSMDALEQDSTCFKAT